MPQDLGLAVSAAAVCLDTDPRGLGGASGTALAFDAMSGAARVVIEASSIGSSTPGGSASRGTTRPNAWGCFKVGARGLPEPLFDTRAGRRGLHH